MTLFLRSGLETVLGPDCELGPQRPRLHYSNTEVRMPTHQSAVMTSAITTTRTRTRDQRRIAHAITPTTALPCMHSQNVSLEESLHPRQDS